MDGRRLIGAPRAFDIALAAARHPAGNPKSAATLPALALFGLRWYQCPMTEWNYLSYHGVFALAACVVLALCVWIYGRACARVPALANKWFDRIAAPIAVVTYGLYYLRYGEHIKVQEGWGWDGVRFGAYAKHFWPTVVVRRVSQYEIQKALPSAVVHYTMRVLHIPRTDLYVQSAFHVATIGCFALTAVLWNAIANELELGRTTRWLGFSLLFVSNAALKLHYYDPVMIDPWALPIGAALFALYLKRRTWAIPPLAFAASFIIPGYPLVLGAALMLFPRNVVCRNDTPRTETTPVPASHNGAPGVGVLAAASVGVIVALGALTLHRLGRGIGNGAQQVDGRLLPLSLVALVAYLTMQLGPIFAQTPRPAALWRLLNRRYLAVAVGIVLGVQLLVRILATSELSVTAPKHFTVVLLLSIAKPLVSVVANTSFFGPCVILMFLLRKEVARHTWELGVGAALALCAFVLLGIDSESRHLTLLLPVAVACVVYAFEKSWGTNRHLAVLVITWVALILSKAWVPYEKPPMIGPEGMPSDYDSASWQRLFMNLGPWTTLKSYGYLAVATLAVFAVLWFLMRRGHASREQC